MLSTQRLPNNRATARLRQISPGRREFIPLDVLMVIRVIAGSSDGLIVFRAREQELPK